MREFRHLPGVTTLSLTPKDCIGCGMCDVVCPHGVMRIQNGKALLSDRDGCMECGACARNCPTAAIHVTPGVGCAAYIIKAWLKGRKGSAGGGDVKCC
jgi:NAD-dependent dihydropyrimidine dehydrogenase PreA subunit